MQAHNIYIDYLSLLFYDILNAISNMLQKYNTFIYQLIEFKKLLCSSLIFNHHATAMRFNLFQYCL